MGQPVNGNSTGPRLANVEVKGPMVAQGVSETASRRRIFTCYPKSAAQETPCAHEIFATIARRAFRRPLTDADLKGAMDFYAQGRKEGGDFDTGIQKGLLAILVSPKFLFRMHEPPPGAVPGKPFPLNDIDLASRLSFFLWAGPPDDELIKVAAAGSLHAAAGAGCAGAPDAERSAAHTLVTDFAFEWLNVHGLELVDPDTNLFPDYTSDLEPAFEKEIELFIGGVFESDGSVMDLLTSNRTYLNERLALHYHIPNVRGGEFRAVTVPDYRRGLLGKGAVLMTTSYANRTSVVLRGAYVLDKFLGTPPAAPPPGVPGFVESQEGGDQLTVRARMEAHRTQPSCNACHAIIDPIGLAMENFNALGQWRDKDIDAGTPIDANGKLADGTAVHGINDLRNYMVGTSLAVRGNLHREPDVLWTRARPRLLRHADRARHRARHRQGQLPLLGDRARHRQQPGLPRRRDPLETRQRVARFNQRTSPQTSRGRPCSSPRNTSAAARCCAGWERASACRCWMR